METGRRGGALRLAVALAAIGATFLAVGVAQAAAQGSLEVCKSADNGMGGRSFGFTVSGPGSYAKALTVTAGQGTGCSLPQSGLTPGDYVVTEAATTPATDVTGIKATVNGSTSYSTTAVLRSRSLAGRTATVRVFEGQLTEVQFTNKAPASQVKVCKTSAAFGAGTLFSFVYRTGSSSSSVFSVPVGSCSALTTYPGGTRVTVKELIPANATVASITVEGAGDVNGISEATGEATVIVHPGVTVVTYDNEATGLNATGFIEICKQSSGSPALPPDAEFSFTISSPGGAPIPAGPITAGSCTEALQVPAGLNTITELPSVGVDAALDHTSVVPSGAFVSENIDNRELTVVVPAADSPADEVIANFFNKRSVGLVKICKSLAANSGSSALANTSFTFASTIPDPNDPSKTILVHTDTVRPGSCSLPFERPIGERLTVTETVPADVDVTSVVVSPSGSGNPAARSGTVNVVAGVNTATFTFTNQAGGGLEICKIGAEAATRTRTFTFRITPELGLARLVSLKAGTDAQPNCTPSLSFPAGFVKIEELFKLSQGSVKDNSNFELKSVKVVPSANRVTGMNDTPTNPITVKAPFGGPETVVYFTDRVRTGSIKVCKSVDDASGLKNDTFDFIYTVFDTSTDPPTPINPGGPGAALASLTPSNGVLSNGVWTVCALPGQLSNVPVVGADGMSPIRVRVQESPPSGVGTSSGIPYHVADIAVSPMSALFSSNLTGGTAEVTVKPGGVVQITWRDAPGLADFQ